LQDSASRDFRGTSAEDWALIELDKPLGRQAGFLDILSAGETSDVSMVAGYAGLRPHVLSVTSDCGAWPDTRTKDVVLGTCSVMLGDSGAPVLVEKGGKLLVAGIFSGFMTTTTGLGRSVSVPASRLASQIDRLRGTEAGKE